MNAPFTHPLVDVQPPIDAVVAGLDLDRRQRARLRALYHAIRAVRPAVLRWREARGRAFDLAAAVRERPRQPLEIPGTRRRETDGGHYLSRDEVAGFARNGFTAPFEVITAAEARDLREQVYALHGSGWGGRTFLGPDIQRALEQTGAWSVNNAGLYQALAQPCIRELHASPRVGDRLASLLGEEVVLWRTQFFEKKPGAVGSFWHQTSDFSEDSTQAAFEPPPALPLALGNLTAWIALDDYTPETGCLRFVPGSAADDRLDAAMRAIQGDRTGFLFSLSDAELLQALTIRDYTTGLFAPLQFIFEVTCRAAPDLLRDTPPLDMPMRAGQGVIFTSMCVHGANGNQKTERTYLASVGRYTAADTKMYVGQTELPFRTGAGVFSFPTAPLATIPVHAAQGQIPRAQATPPDRPQLRRAAGV